MTALAMAGAPRESSARGTGFVGGAGGQVRFPGPPRAQPFPDFIVLEGAHLRLWHAD